MCATFQCKGKTYKPGRVVTGSGEAGIIRHAWAGFARGEILSWWKSRGAVLIDIAADRFAERSELTGKLIWGEVPAGIVLRGLIDIQTTQPLIKIVTRASNPEEIARFQHPRMPVLEPPRFPRLPPEAEEQDEPDLFG